MKTINFKVLLVLFILATVGCSKELSNESIDETASDVNLEATHVPNSKMDYGSFEVKNGIIYFEDTKDLVNTLKALANNVEFDIINYQNKIDKNLSEEEVLAFLDVEKWDENQTFIDFENEHNFQSLRPIYEEKLTLWGEAGLIESDVNNPANCLPFESLPVLTVLNQDAILGVGNKLYKFLNNGVIYEIVDGNINTAAQINENHNDGSFSQTNVKVLNLDILDANKTNAYCYDRGNKNKDYYTVSNQKANDRIKMVNAGSLFSFVEAKVINWKKVGSRYKKFKRNTRTGVWNTNVNFCGAHGKVATNTNSMKYVKVRTYTDFTSPGQSALKAGTGYLYTNSLVYSSYYHSFFTLLR
ncbi:MAG: hypothetical protein ACPGR5_06695 [Chitinophagales bacterium]